MKLVLIFCASVVGAMTNVSGDTHRSLPVPPQELILGMPVAPAEHDGHWDLKKSWGTTDYAAPWLLTIVNRNLVFVPNPPPGGAPPAKSAPPKTVTIQIEDTGFDPAANSLFLVDTSKGGGPAKQIYNGNPIKVVSNGNSEIAWMWVGQRFIVQVMTSNAEPKAYEQWLSQVNTAKLTTAVVTPADKVPRPFQRILFDELNPANNSVSAGTYSTPEESKQAMEALKTTIPKSNSNR